MRGYECGVDGQRAYANDDCQLHVVFRGRAESVRAHPLLRLLRPHGQPLRAVRTQQLERRSQF